LLFPARHKIKDFAAEIFVRRIKCQNLRQMIVAIEPGKAGANAVARTESGEQFGSADIETGLLPSEAMSS
jgi:hypothetical protein